MCKFQGILLIVFIHKVTAVTSSPFSKIIIHFKLYSNMNDFFPETEPVNTQMVANLELVRPINRCTGDTEI